jgi:hypothetical protein
VRGWTLRANFHWGAQAKGLAWSETPMPVADYIELWAREPGRWQQVPRAAWNDYWSWLLAEGVADAKGRETFRADFDNTARTVAVPRPGLLLGRSWPLAEAEHLDRARRGAFADAVRTELLASLAALDEHVNLEAVD